jgi:hypothetical protein
MAESGRDDETAVLVKAWREFEGRLKIYGNALSALNSPCSGEAIAELEERLKFRFPRSLGELLRLANGQKLDRPGVFKSISGWDRYMRHVFLDAASIATAYENFVGNEVLVAEFGSRQIPFSVAGTPDSYRECFCVHAEQQTVSLIWADVNDPWLPPEWQVARYARGRDLAEFLDRQTALYR